MTPLGWAGEGKGPVPDPCSPRATPTTAHTGAPSSAAAGHAAGPNLGFGTVPITGGGLAGSGTGVPEGALFVTEPEIQGLFGYPVCIQEEDR